MIKILDLQDLPVNSCRLDLTPERTQLFTGLELDTGELKVKSH